MGQKISLLLFVLLCALCFSQPVYADAAPPDFPPGSAVGTESTTNVQMVSETVFITIEASDENISDFTVLSADHIIGHVDATFYMVNQGSETESLEVWFPLGVPGGLEGINEITDFAAWVNEVPVTTGYEHVQDEERHYLEPRATWDVTFPPGETVVLRVTYDLYPTGYSPYGKFSYILETGAGWWGSIGQGTVTVIMPYPINRFNVAQNPDMYGSPNLPDYTVDGNTLTWEFTDLEPTKWDNISIAVLEPERWLRIVDAEANVEANPDSVEAHLELARARVGALFIYRGLSSWGNSIELCNLARADYEQAIVLDPENIDVRVEYLKLLLRLWMPSDSDADWEAIYTQLEEGFSISPDNEQLLWARWAALIDLNDAMRYHTNDRTALQLWYDEIVNLSDIPPEDYTPPTETPRPTIEQPTATPLPPTSIPTSTPELTPTAVPTQIPPSPQPTPIPTETRRVCPGAAVLLLVPLGVVAMRKREWSGAGRLVNH